MHATMRQANIKGDLHDSYTKSSKSNHSNGLDKHGSLA